MRDAVLAWFGGRAAFAAAHHALVSEATPRLLGLESP
jgi:hypothetical protein